MPKSSTKLTEAEKKFIVDNCETMTDVELSQKLGRQERTIAKYRKLAGINKTGAVRKNRLGDDSRVAVEADLRSMPDYEQLNSMFSVAEMDKFSRRWIDYNLQFTKEGVLATEKEQISQLVKLEILIDRNMLEQRQALDETIRLEMLIAQEEEVSPNLRDIVRLSDLHRDITVVISSNKSQRKDLLDMQTRHASLLKDLKATRDQRVKNIEESQQSFLGLIKQLQVEEIRKQNARSMELMKIAAQKQREKFEEFHEYQDGRVDKVFLTPESVLKEEGPNEVHRDIKRDGPEQVPEQQ